MSGKELHEYVALIESAEYDVDADELDIEHEQDEYDDVDHENEVDEGEKSIDEDKHDSEDEDDDDVLNEDDGTFWDNFEKDSDFELEEHNGMYCVKGMETGFHYGSHVEYDVATGHLESLKNYE